MTSDRSVAIDAFVERLVRIREEAGRPSFRTMAARSGAISHATLHDAVQGTRLPSWETTVEFARACGVDPQDLRSDWEQAEAVIRPVEESQPVADAEAGTPPAPLEVASPPISEPLPVVSPEPKRSASWTALLVGAGAAAAVTLAAVIAIPALNNDSARPSASGTPTITGEAAAAYIIAPASVPTTTVAKGCPGNARPPRQHTARVSGDQSKFVKDVTVPDCSTQPRGQSVVKTWQFKNTGTVEWKNRFLHRINVFEGSPGCRAPERVAIPDTMPRATVNVSVTIATPNSPATCFARWMQTDREGNFSFPMQRPYYYTFFVK
ncbi:NBR1-Ig-like domain-containing protein [Luteipulveratus mongoliensis]|uniref:NBR1-Ig-like domain-containing protein n=1 Tax=Luteipulveratus mongoliensis TaxID=571913 RepID=UPI0006989707|nr:NBR1-Ig-like domain-containing protein [Luteipulveratus mongoliensis]